MTDFSVDPAAVQRLSSVVSAAGSDVANFRTMLSNGARSPESEYVSGSDQSAADYSEALDSAVHALGQLGAALEGMATRLFMAGRLYADTETANTVEQEP
ncbi:hypothetical protein Aab01nite_49510 [Paractinoplanes abujensis]|uniref:Uncharacterized protein n=1 Tax=Paractinoplanes abujensis TaxID=882441 RepID=A0A7W7G2M9_9ACTN|nr:type VII secretion target [Actinoplanes abujensis]MBB4693982.1 hypothetical protein [Actinoplanes abujensis]GID21361.1 hypothetical protein Aab01nite_49510 [Actinoplanes abujensis]